MNDKRMLAVALLGVVSFGGLVVAALMLTGPEKDAPPAPVPILIIICAVASLVAAVGLIRREPWAILVGITSRAVDALGAIPGIFSAPSPGKQAAAAVSAILSLATIIALLALRKDKVERIQSRCVPRQISVQLSRNGMEDWPTKMAANLRENGISANIANIVGWDWRTAATGVAPPQVNTPGPRAPR